MGSPVCFCGFLFVSLGVLPLHLFSTAELLPALLDTVRAGVVLCTPVRDTAGVVMDFPFACLNPAGRRWGYPPPRPAMYLQQFSDSRANRLFAFQRANYLSGQPGRFELSYRVNGYDNCFRLVSQWVGTGLLIRFTATAD